MGTKGNRRGSNVGKALLKQQSVMLRAQGYTYRQIAARLGILSPNTVHNYVQEALDEVNKRTTDVAQEYRDILLMRQDENFGRLADLMDKVDGSRVKLASKVAMALDIKAESDDSTAIVMKLLGLAAPTKHEHSGSIDFNRTRERMNDLEQQESSVAGNIAVLGQV